ncbi:n-alkane-inducible cytochrome P450 [Neofusicoccum parvum]|uniref:N-alkane-inducible cytochrome P450 n=1 Tax=Neofusicoccum parvum TaxID=310453 RepID=A0ACB5RVN9_9PEZI|nr:n-alkane-inducible cytochrome P450 [Neofusicoccum parvum]
MWPLHYYFLVGLVVWLCVRRIDTIDPENVEAILSTQFKEFGLGVRRATFFPLLGDGIFTQDGRAWKHSRELLRPQFTENRAENFAQIQEAVENLVSLIPEGRPVDLQPLFFRFTLDTTTFLLFGESIGSLHPKSAELTASKESDFAEAFTVAQDCLAQRGRLGDLYWLIGGPRFWKACNIVHTFVDSMVRERLQDSELERSSGKYVFLDALLEQTRDVFTLRSQLLNVLLAGRDTTACCLSWAFRLLSRHPDVLAKLRAEIDHEVGSDPPQHDDIKRMTYLSHVLKECSAFILLSQ